MGLDVNMQCHRGAFELDVELDVQSGDVVALLGPNGSGKSSFLRAIAGLDAIDGGTIILDGVVLDSPSDHIFVAPDQRPIAMVFQHYALFRHLSALDNVAFGLRAKGTPRTEARRRAQALLARIGLADRTGARPHQLSGGQAQRVALARALAIEPRLLLLDEPLAALDATTRRDVRSELGQHLGSFEGARILVTHDPVDAYALADRIAILDGGRVVQCGTISEITAQPRSRYVADLVGTNLVVGSITGSHLHVTGSNVEVSVTASFDGPAFATIRPQSITLSRNTPTTSARNTLTGTVADVTRLGDRARVEVIGSLTLIAEVTINALNSLDLRPGDTVHAAIKATDIDTYPA